MQAVALIPGFLGFDHVGEFTYFADRFAAALRATLAMPVVPLPTLPLGSLFQRQKALLESLHRVSGHAAFAGCRWHLVGHSTGGLDAALLARTRALAWDEREGSRYSDEPLSGCPELLSVTTISAPHYGTCLSRSAVARMTRSGKLSLAGVLSAASLARDLLERDQLSERVRFATGTLAQGSVVPFLKHVFFDDELARDLDPEVAARLSAEGVFRRGIRVRSIASVTPRPSGESRRSPREDRLFRELWQWTAEQSQGAAPRPPELPLEGAAVIASRALGHELADADNDGVVNTNRQALPGTLAGVVVGDHGDVIGRYRRRDLVDRKIIDPGLLTSGAGFGDDEFFGLIRLVAAGIAGAA